MFWNRGGYWLLVLIAGELCLGCTHSRVGQPVDLVRSQDRSARYSLAADLQATPALRIPGPAATPAQAGSLAVAPAPTPLNQAGMPARPAAAPVRTVAATSAAAPAGPTLRDLYRLARQQYATMDSYIARLRRREQVNGKDRPEELLIFKFRKRPWSVYFKWLGSEGRGREVVYVQGQHGNLIHTLLAAGDMPFMPAGKHMALAPDNIFVRSASRHAITEAGIGHVIDSFGRVLESMEKGEKKYGSLRYLGRAKRPEYPADMDAVEHLIPPGSELQLPRGGRRLCFFDPTTHLPVVIITQNDRSHEVEYYCYDRIQAGVKLDDDDFDPDKLWPPARR